MHLQPFRFERNASALGYTRVLADGHWCPRPELHRHCARFKCAVSALDYVGEMVGMKGLAPPRLPDSESGPSAVRVEPHARELVHPAGLPPANSSFEAKHDCNFPTDAEMVGRLGFAPSSRRLRAGTSLSKFATLMAVCKDRDAKAELNHRGQICEVLIDTGISRRGKRIPSAPKPAPGHYFDRARSLPAGWLHLGNGRA